MFFPIGDDNSDRVRTPYVNYLLLAVNILVFIFLQDSGRNMPFLYMYATVPQEILAGRHIDVPGIPVTGLPVYLTLVTSIFMHGNWIHLLGNMLYLWIFGDNLENSMGHKRYLIFYMLCGLIASLSHVFATAYFGQNTMIPGLGASGAIAGVLGGYLLLFPTRRVRAWFILGFWPVPAFIVVGSWAVLQFLNGYQSLGAQSGGGIAYAAHIGGFIAGLLLVKLFVLARITPGNETYPGGTAPRSGWR